MSGSGETEARTPVKPEWIFDRDHEWRQLAGWAARPGGGRPRLGIVSGRRRQGKTYLLQALIESCGGLYFGATEATSAESLSLLAEALARHSRLPVPPRLASWDEGVRYLFAIGVRESGPVVLDEFPYLSMAAPALPSILQREIDQGVSAGTDITLLLCGSALSVMGGLLRGSAPLRGRAGLELMVRPFEYQLAARYWGLSDPRLAVLHNAVVGGTPAYRDAVSADSPRSLGDFDDWVTRTVLSPATPLFREARYLLAEEPSIRDTALYHSVLAAVANGNATRGGIASYIGRKATDIGHHLNVLEDCGLLRREPDVFRSGRSRYRVAEPLVTFYQVVMRPQWGPLESGRAASVWPDARARFQSQVAGPHFEQLCRAYALSSFAAGTFPGTAGAVGEVGAGVVSDPAGRSAIEVDVAVLGPALPGERRRVLSLGEAKLGDVMGMREVARLRRARDLLTARGYDTRDTVLACYGGAGFEPGMPGRQDRDSRVALIGLDQMYGGSPAGEGGSDGVR
jgi:AAA+ ATPase superfamily predicted ATPase